jgi:hypothetical protein
MHFIVFKQTACHLLHEANVEQVFSRTGNVSHHNMHPEYLAHLVMVGMDKKSYTQSTAKMMLTFICSCRNKNQAKAIYPKGTSHHTRLFRGPSTNDMKK